MRENPDAKAISPATHPQDFSRTPIMPPALPVILYPGETKLLAMRFSPSRPARIDRVRAGSIFE
jgi:hypothetical protein